METRRGARSRRDATDEASGEAPATIERSAGAGDRPTALSEETERATLLNRTGESTETLRTLADEERQLQAELDTLRRTERIAILRREVDEAKRRSIRGWRNEAEPADDLEDGATTSSSAVAATPPRRANDLEEAGDEYADHAPAKRHRVDDTAMKVIDPKPYSGTNHREYLEFIRGCEQVFETRPTHYRFAADRVLYARGLLRGDPQNAWYRKEEREGRFNISWEEFKDFLLDELKPASLREVDVVRKYRSAQQGRDQKVARFAAYMDELEAQMEPYTEAQRCNHLLHALRPEISDRIIERLEPVKSREELIAMAIKIEETVERRRLHDSAKARSIPSPSLGRSTSSRPQRSYRPGGTSASSANAQPIAIRTHPSRPPPRDGGDNRKANMECYNCGTKGHLASECQKKPQRPRGDAKGKEPMNMASVLLARERKGDNPRHLTATVRLRGTGDWVERVALIDSGATFNFISQLCAKEIEAPLTGNTPPAIRTLDGQPLQTYGSHLVRTVMRDTRGKEADADVNYLAASMVGYDVILGMPWLKQQDPDIRWSDGAWRLRNRRAEGEPPEVILDSRDALAATLQKDDVQGYLVAVTDYTPQPHRGGYLMAAEEVHIPTAYSYLKKVFSKEAAEQLPMHGPQDHAIELDGGSPTFGPLYNLSATELGVLREYIDENLAKGFIRPSSSPAGAPILFVKKKDGSLRLCVDYRALNRITVKNRYPLPLISEALDRLVGAKIYTKLDIRSAYNLVRIREGDEWKTAFRTRYGHFEYLVMPFGLANAPATFQAYINRVLSDYLDVFCIVYLDDILIYSQSVEEHTTHVRLVLERLYKHGLYAKLEKCEFHVYRVGFVGFNISPTGVSMEESRVSAVKDWPEPKKHRDIQVFLGFANFYRRFIAGFSRVSEPLSALLKGAKAGKFSTPFQMTEPARQAFQALKNAFSTAPTLVHYDPAKEIRVETDASGYAIAGVLSQPGEDPAQRHWHPVAYWSRKMAPAERNYAAGDAEMLAIVEAFKQWRHYLEGAAQAITVVTDHANLRSFMTTKELNRRHARWAERLAAFNFTIVYRQGRLNPADAPSRRPDYEEEAPLAPAAPQWKLQVSTKGADPVIHPRVDERPTGVAIAGTGGHEHLVPRQGQTMAALTETAYDNASMGMRQIIAQSQAEDVLAKQVRQGLESSIRRDPGASRPELPLANELANGKWTLEADGVVCFQGRAYVPAGHGARAEILRRHHDDPLAGHFGYARTIELVRRKYFWPGMAKEIKGYVAGCATCQRIKPTRHKPYRELQSLPPPTGPWRDITMDFVTDLPPSKRRGKAYDSILVVVDRYTKMARYIPVLKTIDAPTLADVFVSKILRHYGVPQSIVTDRGTVFTAKFWASICFYLKVRRRLSTAFHPQTDGQTERQNQTLEQYLRAYVNYQQDDWVRLLPLAEFAYNASCHSSTGVAPFYAYSLTNPEMDVDIRPLTGEVPSALQRAEELQEVRREIDRRYTDTVKAQAKYYNRKTKPQRYAVGDSVWLSARNIRTRRPNKKLDYKYLGPFEITDAVGTQAYRLRLPETLKVHPVFHVSLLEPYTGNDHGAAPPEPLNVDGEEQWEVEEVLDSRIHRGHLEYLVKWLGYGNHENQWVSKEDAKGASDCTTAFHRLYPSKPGPTTTPATARITKRRKGQGQRK
jgi:transposase InsO family protein